MSIKNKKNTADYVVEEIKRRFDSGEYKVGDKLPTQDDFALQLGVSRSSLREALQLLRLAGIIVQKPRVGTILVSMEESDWANPILATSIVDDEVTVELLEARKHIETAIAHLAIKRITDNELDDILTLSHKMHDYAKKSNSNTFSSNEVSNYILLDMQFHLMIVKASKNRFLINAYTSIYGLLGRFMTDFYRMIPTAGIKSYNIHQKITQALCDKDEVAMVAATSEHIEMLENLLSGYKNINTASGNK